MTRNKQRRAAKGAAGQNRKSSELFLQKYQSGADVITLESGLMYRVIEQGDSTNNNVSFDDTVIAHQRVSLSDGTVIADTYKSGEADRYAVNEAIEGLQEGLVLMCLGSRYEFVVPPTLAWGKRGAGNKIGANAALKFDIKIIAIE